MNNRCVSITAALLGLSLVACAGSGRAPAGPADGTESTGSTEQGSTTGGTQATEGAGLAGPFVLYDVAMQDQPDFALPYPSSLRTGPNGAPQPQVFFGGASSSLILDALSTVVDEKRGFSPLSTIYFRTSEPLALGSSLPVRAEPGGPVVLVNVSEGSSQFGVEIPVVLDEHAQADEYWDDNTLTLRPLSSAPMASGEQYVAALMTGLESEDGRPAERGPGFVAALEAGDEHAEQLDAALQALDGLGYPRQEVVALTTFVVDDVHRISRAVQQTTLDTPAPVSGWALVDDRGGYSVFEGSAQLPEYLSGSPPFLDEGTGRVEFDGEDPIVARDADVRMHLVIPTKRTPSMPLVVYRHGTGGDAASHHASPQEIGPVLAAVGIASLGYDAALHGERNGGPYDALGRSLTNFVSTRDFLFQAAADLAGITQLIETGALDFVDEQGQPVSLSHDVLLFGHSQGTQEVGMLLGAGVAPTPAGVVLSSALGAQATIALEQEFAGTKIICLLGSLQPICDELFRDHPVVNMAYQATIDPVDPIHSTSQYQTHMLVVQGSEDVFTTPNGTEAIMAAAGIAMLEPGMPHSEPHVVDGLVVQPWPVEPGPAGHVRGACQYATGHFAYRELPEARAAWQGFLESVVAGAPQIPRCEPR